MKQKSILLIGNYPPPFGGVPRHIEYLVKYLVDKEWNVHILSGGNSGIEYKNGFTVYKPNRISKLSGFLCDLYKLNKVNKLGFLSIMKNSFREWLRYMAYISIGRQIIKNNNINIISSYNLYTNAPIGAVLSDEFNIPLVVTNFGEIFSMPIFFRNNLALVKYICNISKKNLAMSFHCAKSYSLIGLSPQVEVIPYGVDINIFSPTINRYKIRDKYGINRKAKVILFVGRLIKDMGLHTVLEAIPNLLREIDNLIFIIVGEKGELLRSALDLADKYNNCIFVESSVPYEELPLYYAASTIVIVPTKGDRACGSLAAIEAMAVGKPVIAANIGGIPEIIIDKENGVLISPEDAVALHAAITNLIKDDALIKRMGSIGRQRVEKYFDESRTDHKIENIFSDFVRV